MTNWFHRQRPYDCHPAITLGIAESTAPTHLHRLFAKTGASRQTDLVKIVAGFRSPLLG